MTGYHRCYQKPLRRDSPQIRLLQIKPAENHNGLIRIQSTIVDMDKVPPFDALSYVWGDQSCKLPVSLDDEPFGVGDNLHAALDALRETCGSNFLWVDAICINQCDNSEKNYQVPLMARIYSKATRVIGWLGRPDGDSDLAISSLRRCAEDRDHAAEMAFTELPRLEWNAIHNLLRRPYWTRVWIIQEYRLAREFIFLCGRNRITSDDMRIATDALALFIRTSRSSASNTVRALPKSQAARFVCDFDFLRFYITYIMVDFWKEDMKRSQMVLRLNELMARSRKFNATDSRDYVYGLLGLLPPSIFQLVQPDYNKSTVSTFVDFAALIYEEKFGMIAQSGIGHAYSARRHAACASMPSWVPSYRGHFIDTAQASGQEYSIFNAGGSDAARWCRIEKSLALEVSGVRLDTVIAICAPLSPLGPRAASWAFNATKFRAGDNQCGSWRRAFFHTLLLGKDRHIVLVPDPETNEVTVPVMHQSNLEEQYLSLMQSGFKQLLFDDDPETVNLVREERQYWAEENRDVQLRDIRSGIELRPMIAPGNPSDKAGAAFMSTFSDVDISYTLDDETRVRSFITTNNGYMGLAPVGTKLKDEIVIVMGCPVPLVMRRKGNAFEVIGDIYIYGLMEGQVFERLASIENLTLL